MIIGICDDRREEREQLFSLCDRYAKDTKEACECVMFSSGEEVLAYCENSENPGIDLLFLDIEMNGMSGIELKEAVVKENKIWRIVFVTSHLESALDAYGIKTIGFVPKPPAYDQIEKKLQIVADELKENVTLTIKGYKGDVLRVKLEDVAYLKAAGSYTEIYTYSGCPENGNYVLSTKKLGEIEKNLQGLPIVRVHKSYLVNMEHVLEVGASVKLRDMEEDIPIGRSYKEAVKCRFYEYGRDKIRRRL